MKIFKKFGKRFISGIICTAIAVSTFSFGSSATPLNKNISLFTASSGKDWTSNYKSKIMKDGRYVALSEEYTAIQPSKDYDIFKEYTMTYGGNNFVHGEKIVSQEYFPVPESRTFVVTVNYNAGSEMLKAAKAELSKAQGGLSGAGKKMGFRVSAYWSMNYGGSGYTFYVESFKLYDKSGNLLAALVDRDENEVVPDSEKVTVRDAGVYDNMPVFDPDNFGKFEYDLPADLNINDIDSVVLKYKAQGLYTWSGYGKEYYLGDVYVSADFPTKDKFDLNGDSVVTIADLIIAKKMIARPDDLTDAQREIMDVNSDGFVNVLDMLLLKKQFTM